MKRVFLDASVLFSALYSAKGGSSALIQHIRQGKIVGITSQTVIEELLVNCHKIPTLTKQHIEEFLVTSSLVVREYIKYKEIEPYIDFVEEKDVHVVAGAILTHCNYLVTLDKKHINNNKTKRLVKKWIQIVSPKELLREIFTQ